MPPAEPGETTATMTIPTWDWTEPPPPDCRGGALTIGNFDGVHRGHAALVAAARRLADRNGGPAVVLTFDPHPLQLLRPAAFQPVLTTTADRVRLLLDCGADRVLVLRTTPELLHLRAEEFFAEVVRGRLAARALVEGVNFGFGRDRRGDVGLLADLCRAAAIDLTVLPPVEVNGRPVSSSRVKAALAAGQVRETATLLGRPYQLRGTVVVGQRRGRQLGFPTANLADIPTLVPGDGVYAVRVTHRGRTWPGAAHIGPNPTFGEGQRKVEVHLLDFTGELLGEELAVAFIDRLRDTRPFPGPDALVAQLRRDIEQARALANEDVP
jgi:riboflavin kinase/FMN adenylyltransferase